MANRTQQQLTVHMRAHKFTCDSIVISVQIHELRLRMKTAITVFSRFMVVEHIRSAFQEAMLISLAYYSATIIRSHAGRIHIPKNPSPIQYKRSIVQFDVTTSQVLCFTRTFPFTHLPTPCSLTPALYQISLRSKPQSPFVTMIDSHAFKSNRIIHRS
jgi:hypothetical protein